MTTLELNNDLDQLAAESHGINPEAEALIALAWWFTEAAVREETGACSMGHDKRLGNHCQCCQRFASLKGRAAYMERRL